MILREAHREDSKLLFAQRNERGARQASRHTEALELCEHERWLDGVLQDPRRRLLVAELDGEPVGQVRFECRTPERAEISISLDPEYRRRGFGKRLIDKALDWAKENLEVSEVQATVRASNTPSLRAFRSCGFEEQGRLDHFVELLWRARWD